MQRLEENELRKADRTVWVNCYDMYIICTCLQLRLMRGVFANANDSNLLLVMFPAFQAGSITILRIRTWLIVLGNNMM